MKNKLGSTAIAIATSGMLVACGANIKSGNDANANEGEVTEVSVQLFAESEGANLQASNFVSRITNLDFDVVTDCNGTKTTVVDQAVGVNGAAVYDLTTNPVLTFTLDAGCVSPHTFLRNITFDYQDIEEGTAVTHSSVSGETFFANTDVWTTNPTKILVGSQALDSELAMSHNGAGVLTPGQNPVFTIKESIIAGTTTTAGTANDVMIDPLYVDLQVLTEANSWCSDITIDVATADTLVLTFAAPEINGGARPDNLYDLVVTEGTMPSTYDDATSEPGLSDIQQRFTKDLAAGTATYVFSGIGAGEVGPTYDFSMELIPLAGSTATAAQKLERCRASVSFEILATDAQLDL